MVLPSVEVRRNKTDKATYRWQSANLSIIFVATLIAAVSSLVAGLSAQIKGRIKRFCRRDNAAEIPISE